jgi:chromosome segregation ATPase
MTFLNMLRGNGEHPDAVRSEMSEIAARIHDERSTLESLVFRAGQSAKELDKLTDPIAKMNARLAAVEQWMNAINERVPEVASAHERAEALLGTHQQIETQLRDSGKEAARIKSEIGDLGHLVETATGLKRELAQVMESAGPLRALKGDADELKGSMADLATGYGRLRERHDDLEQASTCAVSRLQAIEEANQALTRTVEGYRRRVEELEQSIGGLTQAAAGASDARHQLLTLKSLADQVTQKVAALENQRDAVDRVARDVSRLDDLAHRVDAEIREQENQIVQIRALSAEVDTLRALYDSVAPRSQEIRVLQQEVDEQERAIRRKLAELGEQLQNAVKRFDLEHRGLETVSHRITDLRAAVKDGEEQVTALTASTAKVTELGSKVDTVWNRVGFLMADVAKLDEETKSMRTLRADAQRIRVLMQEAALRGAEIEKGKPTLEAVTRDLAALRGTHETIKDALDQVRAAKEEVVRVRSTQVETEVWLKAVQEPLVDLQGRLKQVDAMTPTVESVQKRLEWMTESMQVVAAHRQHVDELGTRLTEVQALGAQLDDRTKTFRSRLDVAEGRFLLVTRQAEEAERIANLVAAASLTAGQVDNRLENLTRSLASCETRSEGLEAVAERVRLVGQELEQRQTALDKASEHLARASVLRQQAADAVQQLDERTRIAETTIETVEDRTKRLDAVSQDLDVRAGKLRAVKKDMERFEGDLDKWEASKQELQLSLEQLAARQSTVEAIKANIREMFDLGQRTANDLTTAAEVHRDIQQFKPTLDDLLHRLRDADAVAAGLELRKREIEHAERRLARAEAVLIDIRSSLETLHNQKATLDQVIEKAGALAFQVQQGEALIDRLRKERDITNAVHVALDDSPSRVARAKAQ